MESITRTRLQEKEGKTDWKGSWTIDRKERRPGLERVKALKQ